MNGFLEVIHLTSLISSPYFSNKLLLNGTIRHVPSFIVNFRFPWGVLVLVFEIPRKFVPFLEFGAHASILKDPPTVPPDFSPAEVKACQFLMASELEISSTLKLIPVATEGPWLVRNLVTGTPVIIGNKLKVRVFRSAGDLDASLSTQIKSAPYLELDLDIGDSIKPRAKKIVSMCRTHMASLACSIGFVIQGESTHELPEQMLAGLSLNRINPLSAPRYPSRRSKIPSASRPDE